MDRKLTPKQKKFVEEYLIDLNATQAAIRAGYSKKNAHKIGPELVGKTRISAHIRKAIEKRSERTEIKQDDVLKELCNIGFSNLTDYLTVSNGVVTIKDFDGITKDKLSAVSSVKQTRDGVEIKLYDKIKALEDIGKHLGMFNGLLEDKESLERLDAILDGIKNRIKQ